MYVPLEIHLFLWVFNVINSLQKCSTFDNYTCLICNILVISVVQFYSSKLFCRCSFPRKFSIIFLFSISDFGSFSPLCLFFWVLGKTLFHSLLLYPPTAYVLKCGEFLFSLLFNAIYCIFPSKFFLILLIKHLLYSALQLNSCVYFI